MIWNRSLSASEVQQLYFSTLTKYNSSDWSLYVNQSNVTEGQTYTFQAHAADAPGNFTATERRQLSIDTIPPAVSFASPTPSNGSTVSTLYAQINASIIDSTLKEVIFDWNGTNTTLYNDSLIILMNFDNRSALGENSSQFFDLSKYRNNGTCSGATCPVYNQSGKYGTALTFDTSDIFSAGNTSRPNGSFTFMAWLAVSNTDEIESESTSSTVGTSGQHYAFWPTYSDKPYSGAGLSIGTNGLSVFEHSDNYMPPLAVYSSTIGSGWNHVAVVYTSKQPAIYLNGQLVRTGQTSPKLSVLAPYWFGNGSYGGFNGSMDDVLVWNRSLSAAEIQGLYYTSLAKHNSSDWSLFVNRSNLTDGQSYTYRAHAADAAGSRNQTELRTLSIDVPPQISFVNPTPVNNTLLTTGNVSINITANDTGSHHSVFVDINRSLVGWWRFNNESGETSSKFIDWSSWGRNATCSGGSCPVVNQSGKLGGALTFDGANDYLSVSAVTGLTSIQTKAAWVRFSYCAAGCNFYVFDEGGNNNWIQLYDSDNDGQPIIRAGTLAAGGSIVDSGSELQTNTWYHIAVSSTTGGSVKIYIDGALSNSIGGASSQTPSGITIGSYDGGTQYPFNGSIDDIQLFNRELSAIEIATLYNATSFPYNTTLYFPDGNRTLQAYAQDTAGNVNSTELRQFSIDLPPGVSFVSPTPSNASGVATPLIAVNVSSSDAYDHSVFVDFRSSLLLWLRFNNESGENASQFKDWSTQGNNGTCDGSMCPVLDQSGKLGEALTFDGFDDTVNISDNLPLRLVGNFSISVWVYPLHGTKGILGKQQRNSPWNGYSLVLGNALGNNQCSDESGVGIILDGGWFCTSTIAPNRTWTHIAWTFNGTGDAIYLNGTLQKTAADSTVTGVSDKLLIGGALTYPGFNGSIDDVLIFNRALNASEIRSLYSAQAQQYGNTFGTLSDGYYNFTAYAQDLAGNVNSTGFRTVTVDTTTPTVALNAPPNGTWYTQGTTTFNFTASGTNLDTCLLYGTFGGSWAANASFNALT